MNALMRPLPILATHHHPLTAPPLILRAGCALCFIGHGAFGFITKAEWLPYFGVAGIPEDLAWRLMPWIGALDVLAGMAVLFAPSRLPLFYMVFWAAWTAALRPLAGESIFEMLERSGNFGVPLALLLWAGVPRPITWRALTLPIVAPFPGDPERLLRVRRILVWTTCLLLGGHGALGAVTTKPLLTAHYVRIGLSPDATAIVGWFEIALAVLVALRPATGLLLCVAAWKLLTESLFIVSGAPIWEWIERAGSYAAPLALALLAIRRPPDRGRHRAPSCRSASSMNGSFPAAVSAATHGTNTSGGTPRHWVVVQPPIIAPITRAASAGVVTGPTLSR